MKPFANPIMVVGDNPALRGGLARSARDIAWLFSTLAQFRVACLGRGMGQRSELPFLVYDYPESGQWGEGYIEYAWKNFARGDEGIILTTDDLSRRQWFSDPVGLPDEVRGFLGDRRNFHKWAYVPLDSTGPNGSCLPVAQRDCLRGYDRVLVASEWGKEVMIRSGREDVEYLPHGFWPEKFHIVPGARSLLDWKEDEIHVGCVMANQERKDFPTLFQVFHDLQDEYGDRFHGWLHTDVPIRAWNIYALATDYGVERTDVTFDLSDEQLAVYYSACHATLLPSGGEGFGYPIAESMACGTPCVVTDWAGGAELVARECRVAPLTFRVETPHNSLRAINSAYHFEDLLIQQIEDKEGDWEFTSREVAAEVEHLQWPRLRERWVDWIEKGLAS